MRLERCRILGMVYLAIDIGATKTLIALFSKRGRVLRRVKFPTARGSKKFLADLTENLENPNNVVVIEWGESVADLLPENHKRVEIIYNDEGREVKV